MYRHNGTTRGFRIHTSGKENKLGGEEETLKATNFRLYTLSTWHREYKSVLLFISMESETLKQAC